MVSVTDMTKLLELMPLWKRLKSVPMEIDEMKARIEALESALASPAKSAGKPCPACGEHAVRRTKSEEPEKMVDVRAGVRVETWTCSACGDEDVLWVRP